MKTQFNGQTFRIEFYAEGGFAPCIDKANVSS